MLSAIFLFVFVLLVVLTVRTWRKDRNTQYRLGLRDGADNFKRIATGGSKNVKLISVADPAKMAKEHGALESALQTVSDCIADYDQWVVSELNKLTGRDAAQFDRSMRQGAGYKQLKSLSIALYELFDAASASDDPDGVGFGLYVVVDEKEYNAKGKATGRYQEATYFVGSNLTVREL